MIERLRQIWAQRQLLFTPKQYPKYLNNKLRVFAPSNSLKASLAALLMFSIWRLKQEYMDEQVIIPYPAEPDTSN